MSSQIQEEMDRMSLAVVGKMKVYVNNGEFICADSEGKLEKLVTSLNRLKLINDGLVEEDPSVFSEVVLRYFHLCDFSEVGDQEHQSFIQVLSLWISSGKINRIINNDMSIELIDYISDHYIETIEVFRNWRDSDSRSRNLLFLNCSFISPLLITISFSFKFNYPKSKRLIKILSLVSIYHLNSSFQLFDQFIKLFMLTDSTNMEVFDVFNKLWAKTLENTIEQVTLDDRFLPGPVSLLNRFELLRESSMSTELIDQIIPYDSNEFLLILSKNLVTIYSQLKLIKNAQGDSGSICGALSAIMSFLSTDYGSELILTVIANLNLEEDLFNLQSAENQEFKPVINYIFFKCSHLLNLNSATISPLTKSIPTTNIVNAIEVSDFARCKIFFEVIDHNLKTDFSKDFQLLFSLETSLFYQWKQYNLSEHIDSLAELGSCLSVDGIHNNLNFILQNALINQINPKRELPSSFKAIINYKRFPPLPRSDFLGFQIHDITSEHQLNLKNFTRLIDCLLLNTSIIQKTLNAEISKREQLGFTNDLKGKDLNSNFTATDLLLDQTLTALYINFIIADELKMKSFGYVNKLSSTFFDYGSISNVLKLQTFKIMQRLFYLYDTFGLYKLLKFVTEISLQDLKLQKISISLLNHLFFHTNDLKMQSMVSKNSLTHSLLKEYILAWNEPSMTLYKEFNDFLKIDTATLSKFQENTGLDKMIILKDLGYTDVKTLVEEKPIGKLLNIVSPASSSSSASNVTFNMTNNYANSDVNSASYSSSRYNSTVAGQNSNNHSPISSYNNYVTSGSFNSSGQRFNNNSNYAPNQQYNYNNSSNNYSKTNSTPYMPNNNNNNNNNNYNNGAVNNFNSRQENFLNTQAYSPTNYQYSNNINTLNTKKTTNDYYERAGSSDVISTNWKSDLSQNNTNSFNQQTFSPNQNTPIPSIYNTDQYYNNLQG
jgi:hypothetical protein